jgi:hypothetical protein
MMNENLRGDFRVAALRGDGGVELEELTSRVHPRALVDNGGVIFTSNELRYESRSRYMVALRAPFIDAEFHGANIETPSGMRCTGPCRTEQSARIVSTRGAAP